MIHHVNVPEIIYIGILSISVLALLAYAVRHKNPPASLIGCQVALWFGTGGSLISHSSSLAFVGFIGIVLSLAVWFILSGGVDHLRMRIPLLARANLPDKSLLDSIDDPVSYADIDQSVPHFVSNALRQFWAKDVRARQRRLHKNLMQDPAYKQWCDLWSFKETWAREALAKYVVETAWKPISIEIYGAEAVSDRTQIANANKAIQNTIEMGGWTPHLPKSPNHPQSLTSLIADITGTPEPATGWWLSTEGTWEPPPPDHRYPAGYWSASDGRYYPPALREET